MADRQAAKPTCRPADRSVPLVIRQPETPQAMIKRGDTLAIRFFRLLPLKKFLVLKPTASARRAIRMIMALLDMNFLISNFFSMSSLSSLFKLGRQSHDV